MSDVLIVFFGREPATFVKELIYRSLERQNLDKVYRQIQELRKRLRTREQKAVCADALASRLDVDRLVL